MENRIRAIIAEDMEAYLDTLAKLVSEVAPQVEIVGKASTLRETETLIGQLSPNLVFLDIQFEEEGSTAFDLLRRLRRAGRITFQIIFITAHLEPAYYAEAFNYGALHFLEKPVDKDKLKESIQRAITGNANLHEDDLFEKLNHLEKQISSSSGKGRMVVEGSKFSEVIQVGDIILLEAAGRYTNLRLADGRQLMSCHNLGEFEKKLRQYENFCRIHHSKIINLSYVKRYSKRERIIELLPPHGSHIASKERMKEFILLFETEGS